MNISQDSEKTLKVIDEKGFDKTISALISKLNQSDLNRAKSIWQEGIYSEIEFWDSYFATKGLQWADSYEMRFDPDLPLQSRPVALLPPQIEINILDVGAGPHTFLGKKHEGKQLNITAVDPLADEYELIFDKYQIPPAPVKTRKLAGEELTTLFDRSTFDFVVARNCIDHSYSPEIAILQMVDIVKSGSYVLLEHRENEAVNANYLGLHQWNFSMSPEGDFIISSKFDTVNMTRKYADYFSITCEIVNEPDDDGEWLITRILKK